MLRAHLLCCMNPGCTSRRDRLTKPCAAAPNRPPHHRAFTLVEMLVVIAIIAVLASLLLVGIQGGRETTRRAECSNNLRNLHLAILQFENAKGSLPASRTFWNDARYKSTNLPTTWTTSIAPQQYLTWVHELMPYFEQKTMRNQVEAALSGPMPDVRFIAGKLKIVLCPSDELDANISPVTLLPYSQQSYAVNSGVTDNYFAPNPALTGYDWPQNGLFDNRLKGSAASEIQKIFRSRSLGIPDGTTNTILIAENSDLEEWNYAPHEFQVGIVWTENGAQSLNKYPTGLNPPHVKPGTFAEMAASGANLTPYARPLSQHPTGFMVVFADGHSKFISESIAYDVYARLMTSDGARYMPAGINEVPPSASTLNIRQMQNSAVTDGNY